MSLCTFVKSVYLCCSVRKRRLINSERESHSPSGICFFGLIPNVRKPSKRRTILPLPSLSWPFARLKSCCSRSMFVPILTKDSAKLTNLLYNSFDSWSIFSTFSVIRKFCHMACVSCKGHEKVARTQYDDMFLVSILKDGWVGLQSRRIATLVRNEHQYVTDTMRYKTLIVLFLPTRRHAS